MRILWLLPEFDFSSAARQASLVLPELARAGHQCLAAAIRGGGKFLPHVVQAGVEAKELSTPHHFPLHAVYNLNALVRDWKPDLIHGWRLPVVRALAMLAVVRKIKPRQVISQPRRDGRPTNIDRWHMRRFAGVMDPGVSLAVEPVAISQSRDPWKIACMGRFDREHGFRDALWAFDVLRYVHPQLKIEFTGSGPERDRLVTFAESGAKGLEGIDFRRDDPDGAGRLGHAAMVWVTSRAEAGAQVALEAQAAGTAVMASRLPGLSAVIADGETGLLYEPADPVALARKARTLIENREELRRLGDAGRERVTRLHAPNVIAAQWQEVYTRALSG